MRMWAQEGSEYCTWHYEDGKIWRRHISLNEDGIRAENALIRAQGGPRTLSFGKPLLQMSLATWLDLRKKFPALSSRDKQEKKRAWLRLARDPEYRHLWLKD